MAERYQAVIISPHLDDAVFSCGGEISRLRVEGQVLVLNLFSRQAANTRIRSVVVGEPRYREEAAAAQFLGYESRNLDELDAIFRRAAYRKISNLFRVPVEEDMAWLLELREKIFDILASLDYGRLYVPLGIGWHVDHILAHRVFEPWAGRDELYYYEDTPYSLIPHATRYRLNELGQPERREGDRSLAPSNELAAWWQAAMAYADTALMRNLSPWIVRRSAVPVVSFYLYRLMALHRHLATQAPAMAWRAEVRELDQPALVVKVEAMALYRSQFREFFSDREDCLAALAGYGESTGNRAPALERYWQPTPG